MIEWFTTAPNPRTVDFSMDSGQRGWRLHAVDIESDATTLGEIRLARAACGITPAHGWSLDFFITPSNGGRNCKRCQLALIKNNGAHPYPFVRLTDREGKYIRDLLKDAK